MMVEESNSSTAALPQVVLRQHGQRWELVITEPRDVADRVGKRLFAAFLKCFHGSDRLLALEQLLAFNHKQLPSDSVAYTRNLRLIVELLNATMYEAGRALQELCNAKVVEKMRDRSVWKPLDERRGKWCGDGRLGKFRNQLGAHLGDADTYDAGLDEVLGSAGSELVFENGEGQLRHSGECVLAADVLLRGLSKLKIELADAEEVFKLTQEAHEQFPDELVAAFREVLDTVGVAVFDESGRADE